jgi:hypothetical protein
LIETRDHQFPRSDAPLAADREAWELADRSKLLRCTGERCAQYLEG